jgi:hypothetical protein
MECDIYPDLYSYFSISPGEKERLQTFQVRFNTKRENTFQANGKGYKCNCRDGLDLLSLGGLIAVYISQIHLISPQPYLGRSIHTPYTLRTRIDRLYPDFPYSINLGNYPGPWVDFPTE